MSFIEKWTGDIVKKMHLYDIKQGEIAKKMGAVERLFVKLCAENIIW